MKNLNLTRDLLAQAIFVDQEYETFAKDHPRYADLMRASLETAKKASMAEKFILPVGGKIINDRFHGLLGEEFRLPYPSIVVEYQLTEGVDAYAVIVAEEITETDVHGDFMDQFADRLTLSPDRKAIKVSYFTKTRSGNGHWAPPVGHYYAFSSLARGKGVNTGNVNGIQILIEALIPEEELDEVAHDLVEQSAYYGVDPILELIEALTCSNVKVVDSKASRMDKARGSRAGALPYDDYKILYVEPVNAKTGEGADGSSDLYMVDNRHRPREHLRRGHIKVVRCGKGWTERRKVWINSVLVNAGIGGKLVKDYQLEKAA